MSDDLEPDEQILEEDVSTASLIYMLYLGSILLWFLPSFPGFVMALVNRKGAPDWLKSHFSFQIHTFWKGFLMTFVSLLLLSVWIGLFGLIGTMIWWAVRNVNAMRYLKDKKPIPDIHSWHYKIEL